MSLVSCLGELKAIITSPGDGGDGLLLNYVNFNRWHGRGVAGEVPGEGKKERGRKKGIQELW